MLVCFVVPGQVVPGQAGRQITAEIVEAAGAAVDVLSDAGLGRQIDEPANARDILDVFLGELLHEAASALATQDAGLFYSVLIDEPATANDTLDGISGVLDILESATADSTQDATLIPGIVPRSAMIAGLQPVFINPGMSREANANDVMINQ